MLGNFQDTCIHQLFEFQVKLTPDAIAVIFEGKQLTYQELNSQANELAHYLKTLGVGPEVLVAACVERSLEMVVGLLRILKAGGLRATRSALSAKQTGVHVGTFPSPCVAYTIAFSRVSSGT